LGVREWAAPVFAAGNMELERGRRARSGPSDTTGDVEEGKGGIEAGPQKESEAHNASRDPLFRRLKSRCAVDSRRDTWQAATARPVRIVGARRIPPATLAAYRAPWPESEILGPARQAALLRFLFFFAYRREKGSASAATYRGGVGWSTPNQGDGRDRSATASREARPVRPLDLRKDPDVAEGPFFLEALILSAYGTAGR